MDPQIVEWLRPFVEQRGPFERVLELGSLDVNGTIRQAFGGHETYIGLDMRDGPGVDLCLHASELQHHPELGLFDCIVASSFFEHDAMFWETLNGVNRLLREGGWFVVTVPTADWGYHGEPKDYWRFTEDALRDVFFEGYQHVELFNPLWATPEGMPHLKCQHLGGWGQR